MTEIGLAFMYKGDRRYIQGADILNTAMEAIQRLYPGVITGLVLTIHRMTGFNMLLESIPGDTSVGSMDGRVATLVLCHDGVTHSFRLMEGNEAPLGSCEYDESVVTRNCTLDSCGKLILLASPSPYTPIETIVAMTKALHQKLFGPQAGKWLFCRWSGKSWPMPCSLGGISVEFRQKLGTKLTFSDVMLRGEMLGSIGFSARSDQ